ncbi:hypothetical protein OU789_11060 [Halocynthiibacter sp. C4]|uniref:hypothetical protein n=1 Tax=Halocynthiibacter sp. C4 TaxID=2992758 RepID=UPI00237AA376|nr:hypothetical protein [Halocynthiibacter sp. C4]MDE0590466.1 hypothetical protein [Halocynthiibacter sp. C4]
MPLGLIGGRNDVGGAPAKAISALLASNAPSTKRLDNLCVIGAYNLVVALKTSVPESGAKEVMYRTQL